MTAKAACFCLVPLFVFLVVWWPTLGWAMFAICLGAGLGYRWRTPRIGKPPEVERLRTRIASDLHDDIGANLSQIAVLAEVLRRQTEPEQPQLAQSLAAITQLSGETIDALSDIVWATNPNHDSLTNLVRRMRRFASELLPAAHIEFSFVAPPLEPELPLDAELRRQLFLIFKESLNNIVRHARCTQTAIELGRTEAQLLLQIRDNGCGFTTRPECDGNGLPNLHRRAQTIGAELTINSFPGGTTILLCVPHAQRTSAPDVQTVRRCLHPQEQWFRLAWQRSRTYLNRGVTVIASHLKLPAPFVKTTFRAQPQPQKRVS